MGKRSSKKPKKSELTAAAYPLRQLLRDLRRFLSPYRGSIAVASVLRACSDVLNLVPAVMMARAVTLLSRWQSGQSAADIYVPLLIGGASFALRQVLVYFSKSIGFLASERAKLDVEQQVITHLMKLDIAWHERENAGNKLKRMYNGSDAVKAFIRAWLQNIIEIIVSLVGVLGVFFVSDRRMALAAGVYVLVYLPVTAYFRRRISEASRAVGAQDEKVWGTVYESVNNMRTVRVLDMADALVRLVGRQMDAAFTRVSVRLSLQQRSNLTQGLLTRAFQLSGTVYIAYCVMHGTLDLGFLVLYITYFSRLTDAAGELADIAQDLAISRVSLSRMMDMLREPAQDAGTLPYPADWKVLSLRNVSYSYGGRDVLRNVTFDIRRGERVGVVGLSGAGKTTLFKLLLKELEDYSGEILVDDVPLRDIRRGEYYRRAAVVLQETEVFNFTLRENIAIATRGSADAARLKRSLDIAHVTDFLKRMPDGVDTKIGEKGVRLSGGERQRVGIARAVYKQPDILFLDEATSHLDLESEERIRDSLHQFFRRVTAVVIAHRLTTIREMDRIVVLEKGRLIEQGSFMDLHAGGGRFYELWEKQKLG